MSDLFLAFVCGFAGGIAFKMFLEWFVEIMIAVDPAERAERDAEELLKNINRSTK